MDRTLQLLSQSNDFKLFGVPHCAAILMTIGIAVGLTLFVRNRATEKVEKSIRITLGVFLLLAVVLDPILAVIRYGFDINGWNQVVQSSLPFYLCDVVSILLAIALFTKNQRLAEIGYLWGLAGTAQGLITPTLWFNWDTVEFHVFFLQHGGVPIAAVLLVWGLGIIPQKGAFKRALYWSWGYMAVVMTINFLINENYGFLNGRPSVKTLFDFMGPYPYYLITLQGVAFTFYYALLKIAPKHNEVVELATVEEA